MYQTENGFPQKKILEGTIPLLYLPIVGEKNPYLPLSQTLVTCLPFIFFAFATLLLSIFKVSELKEGFVEKDTVDGSQKKQE